MNKNIVWEEWIKEKEVLNIKGKIEILSEEFEHLRNSLTLYYESDFTNIHIYFPSIVDKYGDFYSHYVDIEENENFSIKNGTMLFKHRFYVKDEITNNFNDALKIIKIKIKKQPTAITMNYQFDPHIWIDDFIMPDKLKKYKISLRKEKLEKIIKK